MFSNFLFTRYFQRIFGMLKEINSGTIFAHLVMCAPFLGISFHNLEHVANSLSFKKDNIAIVAYFVLLFQVCHRTVI